MRFPLYSIIVTMFLFSMLSVFSSYAQSFGPMHYQFIVRNADGELISNERLTIDLSIYSGELNNASEIYSEQHRAVSSADGLVHLEIGTGRSSQKYSDIIWNLQEDYFVRATISNIDASDFVYEHTSPIVMVYPVQYTGTLKDAADPMVAFRRNDVLEPLRLDDDKLYLSNGSTVRLPNFLTTSNDLQIKVEKEDVSCYGETDGNIDVSIKGGTPPYDYVWSNGQTTEDLNNLKAGEYDLYVADQMGFTAVRKVKIKQPDPMNIETYITDVSGVGMRDGKIELAITGGKPPYSYQWAHGSKKKDQKNLSPGFYKVKVASSTNCSVEKSFVIREPFELKFDKRNVQCYGENSGSVYLSIKGGLPPYEISWSNDKSGYHQKNLPAGKYYVFVKDSWGYQKLDSVSILQPYPLRVKPNVSNISDVNQAGSIELEVSGGIPPYNYNWSTMDTTRNIQDLEDGVYSVRVSDSKGCETIRNNIFLYEMYTDMRDTSQYKVISIGTQTWMAENLNYGKQIRSDEEASKNGVVEKYCYDNNPEYCESFGGLYTWGEMMRYAKSDNNIRGQTKGICPDGWHIPTIDEWSILADYLGGEMAAANRLKNYDYWELPPGVDEIQLNLSGFSAYPAGRMDMSGASYYMGRSASFWSATKDDVQDAWHRTITNRGEGLYRNSGNVGYRFSVRCVKNYE